MRFFRDRFKQESIIPDTVIDDAELARRFDADEVNSVEVPYGGECVAVDGQPWELPNFSLEDARAIGAIAAELVSSGEWDRIEAQIYADLEKRRMPNPNSTS